MTKKQKPAAEPMTGDAALKAQLAAVTDPREALRLICEHEDFLGYDPHYADMRAALLRMAERLGKAE